MLSLLITILLLGLWSNAEPGTLVVFILLLSHKRPVRNAMAFVAGWMTSLATVFAISFFVVRGSNPIHESADQTWFHWAEIGLSALLVPVAVHEWRRRSANRPDEPVKTSRWASRIGPRTAFLAGIFEEPWTVTAAVALIVLRAKPTALETVLAFIVFAVASTASVTITFIAFKRNPERAQELLHRVESSIEKHGPPVFAVLAGVFAVGFAVDGIYGLVRG
jgi:threonine/homoserine/homoserine lactone efflux protein